MVNVKDIIRDTGFIYFLTFWGGFVIGYLGLMSVPYLFLVTNYFLGFISFYLVAHWTDSNRLQHMLLVSALLWLTSATETLLHGHIKGWFLSGAATFAIMFVSWGAFILRERLRNKAPLNS